MNSRERILTALSHREPDRVPFDLGGTGSTGIQLPAYRRLRAALGLPPVEPVVIDVFQQLARVDDDAAERLGVDVKGVAPRSASIFNLAIEDRGDREVAYDQFGIGRVRPKDGGLYFDLFDHPLAGGIAENTLAAYPWPDPADPARFEGLAARARAAAEVEGRAVVVSSLCAGIAEMAAFLQGFSGYYAGLAGNPAGEARLMGKILELKLAYWEQALAAAGPYLDVAQEADDLAGQRGLLMSPRTYRRLIKPLHKELFDFIHSHSGAKVFLHSCGAIRPLIPDFVEIGVNILNPVQVSAAGMDTAELKREFGRDIVFWGGGVDTQHVLGAGTPDQVRDEVRHRLDDLMPGGGFVFAAVHNIQADVPEENIIAMWETVQEFGRYD